MANRPPCKHLDHDFDPRHDACSKCGMTRERWRALDVSAAAAVPKAAQPDERAAFEAQWNVFLASGEHESDAYLMGWKVWQAARVRAPQATPIYQIGAPGIAGHQVVWWDVPQEEYERQKKAGYMKTGIVYREAT